MSEACGHSHYLSRRKVVDEIRCQAGDMHRLSRKAG